jgi:hypothetical protein
MADALGVDTLINLQGASRFARSYAFLYAAFKGKNSPHSTVRDIVDCLIPFITAYTNNTAGRQLDLAKLQIFLQTTFGFDIPIYALEQLLPSLQSEGSIEFRRGPNIYVALTKEDEFLVAREEIDTDFDELAALLSSYAAKVGYSDSPPSGSWDAAIIIFLKPRDQAPERKIAKLHNIMMDAREVETKIVAAFVRNMYEEQPARYEKLVKIFMGILVEEFLSSVSELGQIDRKYPLTVLYDTTVLLRCLGCSGRLQKTASDELTRYLQDIGCQIRFLSGNESEVANVISTILTVKDSGGELEGETADAISLGEESIEHLRMLNNNFVGRLAQMNIFEFNESTMSGNSPLYQISEPGFARFLHNESQRRGRRYGQQNRDNDAGYLAAIMRLRGSSKSRDFASSRFIFVTANRLLAAAARRFLIQQGQLTAAQCPPVLYITQVATIAWLLKDQKLSPDIASRELLINCYAAARPDSEWFRYFREGMEQVVGDLEQFGRENSLVLQAARRIAQEESLSHSAIMQELNAAEILDRSREYAAEERNKILERHEADQNALSKRYEAERAEQTQRHVKELKEAQENRAALEDRYTKEQTERTQRHQRELAEVEKRAAAKAHLDILEKLRDRNTKIIMWTIQLILLSVFACSFFSDSIDIMSEHPWGRTNNKVRAWLGGWDPFFRLSWRKGDPTPIRQPPHVDRPQTATSIDQKAESIVVAGLFF